MLTTTSFIYKLLNNRPTKVVERLLRGADLPLEPRDVGVDGEEGGGRGDASTGGHSAEGGEGG